MTHGSLFSGIGGFDLAASWMGWENLFHCEINEFCQKVLKHHFPKAVLYGDITKTDFTEWRGKIDIVTGGFPCQPYSQAGKRKGKADDRHLWPEMLRAIREIQPRWIVGENVPGLLNWQRGMVLAEIKADLEAAGFEVFPPVILPACGKNAPHRRDRLWIVAYNNSIVWGEGRESKSVIEPRYGKGVEKNALTNTDSNGYNKESGFGQNTGKEGKNKSQENKRERIWDDSNGNESERITPNTGNQGLQGSENNGDIGEIGENRKQQFAGLLQPDWQIFPTQPPLCGGNDGVSNRVDRIKALGNAIVPQVAYEIFKAITRLKA